MGSVIWSDAARDDFERIVAGVARDNPRAAERTIVQFESMTFRLERHPFFGAMVPEFESEALRETWVAPYRVVYSVRGTDCLIHRLVHSSRDITRAIDRSDLPQ